MPVEPKKSQGHHPNRQKQLDHGAQSDQGGATMTSGPKPEPRVYEGPEESNQQRREE